MRERKPRGYACVLQLRASSGWGTLDRFPSMTEAIEDAKALTGGLKRRCHFRLLDSETLEPVSYFDTIGNKMHPSTLEDACVNIPN